MVRFSTLINGSPPGTMVQHLYRLRGAEEWLAGLAVREEPHTLARLPARVEIRSRGAVLPVQHVHLIVLLLQIQGGPVYETFVSVQHEDSAAFIARMAEQAAFTVLLFDGGSPQPVRAFVTQNGFRALFQYAHQAFAGWPGWALDDFDQAKAALYARYPRVEDLWEALSQPSGGGLWSWMDLPKN